MTSPPTIRVATATDVGAGAAVRASAVVDVIVTAEGMSTWLTNLPEEAAVRMLVAEVDDEAVGWCTAVRNVFSGDGSSGILDVTVRPEHRRRGLGAELAARGLDHLDGLGLLSVRGSSEDDAGPRALAERLGFTVVHASSMSAVDPREVPPLPVPEGVTLRSFAEVGDPRPLYELDLEVSGDVPGELAFDAITLEQWAGQFWGTVAADMEASLAAYVDGELAALTMLRVDRPSGRAQNNLTATRRPFRGRGLARLIKSHSLHRAAEAGATVAFTGNDETNAAMLAVNRSLGYRHSSRWLEWERRAPRA